MNKEYVFVKASVCWADEFDCEIFGVFTNRRWNNIKKKTQEAFDARPKKKKEYKWEPDAEPFTIGFGTNEEMEVSSYKEWLDKIEVRHIPEPDAKSLALLFGEVDKEGKSYNDNPNDYSFTFGTGDNYFESIAEREKDED